MQQKQRNCQLIALDYVKVFHIIEI